MRGLCLLRIGLAAANMLFVIQALGADCVVPRARLVSVQGEVELKRAQSEKWLMAERDAELCPGDMLRIGGRSRAAVRLANDSNLRLDQHTTLVLPAPEENISLIEVLRGAVNIVTRTPRPFRVRTPFVNAGVEGTEFLVRVDTAAAQVAVFEGTVTATNDLGTLTLASGELAWVPRGSAPRRERIVRPVDAVQWALYYPSIVRPGEAEEVALREADVLARRGRISEALVRLDSAPADSRTARHAAYRAELLLLVGRVDEAKTEIGRALTIDPRSSDARALLAIIAVVQNDSAEGLRLAREAIDLDPRSATARLAFSYAQQARFDIPAALESAERAAELAPDNALTWARLAELRLVSGDLDAALGAAQRAASADAELARTQTVLGFAHLTRIETVQARQAFDLAINQDQADPMPRLGRGLTRIRVGDLAGGREDIEIASSLDPLNSFMRSYVGNAYYEEKRDTLAGTQFDLGKALDPKDPTPWFYDAIRKQSANRPVEALRDLQKSIDLNDNRGVYRTARGLGDDLAARTARAAGIFNTLGFGQAALTEAAKSLAADPANHSAHRFLADVYALKPRNEIARASGLLYSQLLQPVNVIAFQPQLAETDLFATEIAGPANPSFGEFGSLFARDRTTLLLGAAAGSNSTITNDMILSAVHGRLAAGLGQFHFETDGIRDNNALRQDIYNFLVQSAVSPDTTVQAELRYTESLQGDRRFNFDPADFSPVGTEERRATLARFGARHAFSSRSTALVSWSFRDFVAKSYDEGEIAAPVLRVPLRVTTDQEAKQAGHLGEVQHLYRLDRFRIVSGLGHFTASDDTSTLTVRRLPAPLPALPPSVQSGAGDITHDNAYAYAQFHPSAAASLTAGLSADSLEQTRIGLKRNQVNPKLGLIWSATRDTTVRAAAFRVLKRAMTSNQTIEPAHVAGFTQFFDDVNGTDSRRYGMALEHKLSLNSTVGIEYSRRSLRVPDQNKDAKWSEQRMEMFLHWLPSPRSAIGVSYTFEELNRRNDTRFNSFSMIRNNTLRLDSSYFHPSGLALRLTVNHARQSGSFVRPSSARFEGRDNFWIIDGAVDYRLPKRRGLVGITVKNLLDQDFRYHQDIDPTKPTRPVFEPERQVFVRAVLSF